MTLHEISQLPLGTNVYRVRRGRIESYETLSFSTKHPETYFYLIDRNNYTTSVGFYLGSDLQLHGHWEVDYEKAKEVMWEQLKRNLEGVNEVYFNNQKEIEWKDQI